jgi:pyruvate dehydrogenase E2 component (dihydrolipoamide acetyltransferase)
MIGDAILEIDSPDESNSPAEVNNVEPAPKQEVSISTDEKIPNIKTTPAVRAYARSKNVDILKVKPSSHDGRITKEDIDNFTSQKTVEAPKPAADTSNGDEIITPTGVRKIIFDKMTKSKQIIPHFTITDFIDTGNIEKSIKQYAGKRYLSFTAFFVKAVTVAFKDFPKLNAVYNESNTQLRKNTI